MNDDISYQANPETRGTAPVQFFEADGGAPPARHQGHAPARRPTPGVAAGRPLPGRFSTLRE